MSFLPKDYKAPSGSDQFMKFQDGDNKFRILSDAVVGWEGWKNGKSFRRKGNGDECPIKESEVDVSERNNRPSINFFWAFVVYNFDIKKIQVLSISQKTIQKAIENLNMDEDWGDPKGYTLKVSKVKESNVTKYSVTPSNKVELPKDIAQAYEEADVDVSKLFDGKYPMGEPEKPKIVYPEEEIKADDIPF